VVIGVFLTLLLVPPSAPAQEAGRTVLARTPVAGDFYAAGGSVDILTDVGGDVVVAGGRVSVGRLVKGDVAAIGGEVTLMGNVQDDVRAAGGLVTVNGRVGGDALIAGGSVNLPAGTAVAGRALLAGGDVDVGGTVGESLRVAAATVRIGGEIRGDVDLVAGRIEILPTARIGGRLTYRSPREATIAPAAQIVGPVNHEMADLPDRAARVARTVLWTVQLLFLGGLLLTGVVLVALFPEFSVAAARTIGSDFWKSLAVGFALLVATPVAGVFLVITVLGIPLGGALLALYLVALLVGFLIAVIYLGDLVLRPLARRPATGWRVLSLVVAMVVLGLAAQVPIAGKLLLSLALLVGLGACGIHVYRSFAGLRTAY
jgi:hypothetical protein